MTKEEAERLLEKYVWARLWRGDGPWKKRNEEYYQQVRSEIIQVLVGKASLALEDDDDLFMGRPIPEAAIINLKEAMDLLADECAPKFKMVYNRIVHAYSHLNGFDHEASLAPEPLPAQETRKGG